ncbi:amidohydrolase family protein [Phytohabitans aurantiacus]|uniref:Amidohydrolase n=1 Tax=Phytohabitans aurantiacus TaxID=3016789 RepID=A0ABQ5QYB4_9ACTN|nr:amidohydrolase family protein [Phytohabitans aurantiacus]GLH98926.1 amidohydrolase [Phytohabitans aurantiacus]
MNDDDVPGFWRTLGLPGLNDVHVHFLPPRMLRRVWDHFDSAGPLVGIEWPIRYRWSDAERVAHLDKLGVRGFTALAYAHRPDMAADLNEWTLAFARDTPGCLPSATFYPEPGVLDYVTGALAAGARVFKLHLQVGAFDPLDPALTPVFGLLAETGTPIVIHAGHAPIGAEYTGPEPFTALLARHPRLTTIVAHMGSPDYTSFLDLAQEYERVSLDTTMVFTPFFENLVPFPSGERARLRDLGLAGKVLLGSDFPNIPYQYATQLDGLVDLDLGDDWLRAVCWGNFARLFTMDRAL